MASAMGPVATYTVGTTGASFSCSMSELRSTRPQEGAECVDVRPLAILVVQDVNVSIPGFVSSS
jgi:hypothetical protein